MPKNGFFAGALRLNLDGSYLFPERMQTVDLRADEEELRYSVSRAGIDRLKQRLHGEFSRPRFTFFGNGDFHHLSLIPLSLLREPVHLVLFDNHPDNMVFLAGVHCGSWVHLAARLPQVRQISIFGIASGDVRGLNSVQNHIGSLRAGRVNYYCLGEVSRVLRLLAGRGVHDLRPQRTELSRVVREIVERINLPVYFSLDKDVMRAEDLWTNWDQGDLLRREILDAASAIASRVVAGDVVGEPSRHEFESPIKRVLRAMDGHPEEGRVDAAAHADFNFALLDIFGNTFR